MRDGENHTFDRIVVPVDLSTLSERAIRPALRLAKATGACVELFTWSWDEGEAAAIRRDYASLAAQLHAEVPVVVEAAVTEDLDAAPAIAREAARHGAVICMATHGRSGLGAAMLGSVAEEVLQLVEDPIVLVGPRVAHRPMEGGTVVACVDGSVRSEVVVPVADRWARMLGLPLELIEVLEPTRPVTVPDVGEVGEVARLAGGLAGGASYDVLHGDPAEAIVDRAASGVALLALATHGRTGLARAVMGSVAMKVVHRARCPVLVVRSPHPA
ncbi:MAG: universal stress protein [Acidimicrobiia bacterium]